jgi:hypothetical protein
MSDTKPEKPSAAFLSGRADRQNKVRRKDNPYKSDTNKYRWTLGWNFQNKLIKLKLDTENAPDVASKG